MHRIESKNFADFIEVSLQVMDQLELWKLGPQYFNICDTLQVKNGDSWKIMKNISYEDNSIQTSFR